MATKSSDETLRSVVLEIISDYQRAANYVYEALRTGSVQGIDKVDSAMGKFLKKYEGYEGKIGKKLKNSLEKAIDNAGSNTEKLEKKIKSSLSDTKERVIKVADKADTAIDNLFSETAKKVENFPPKKLSKLMDSKVVSSIEPLGLTGAKGLRYVADKMVNGAEKLSNKVGNSKKVSPVKKATKAAPVKKPAKTTSVKAVAKAAPKKKVAKAAPAKKTTIAARSKAPAKAGKVSASPVAAAYQDIVGV